MEVSGAELLLPTKMVGSRPPFLLVLGALLRDSSNHCTSRATAAAPSESLE